MRTHYLLSVSNVWYVGHIVADCQEFGQVRFEIDRLLHEPKKHTPVYWKAQHDQPSPGDVLTVPQCLLRRCPYLLKRRLNRVHPELPAPGERFELGHYVLLAILFASFALFCWWWTAPPVDMAKRCPVEISPASAVGGTCTRMIRPKRPSGPRTPVWVIGL